MKATKYTRETIASLGVYERNFPNFRIGDTIIVAQRIKEGDKERIQNFEGDIIAMGNNGMSTTFTVRRIGANSVAIERIFPYYSPLIDSIKFVRRGKVRRAKLYYMGNRVGRAARVKEKVITRQQREQQAQSHGTSSSSVQSAQL